MVPVEPLGFQRGQGLQGTGPGKGKACRWQGPAGPLGQAAADGAAG